MWRRLAENVAEPPRKGDRVLISGRPRQLGYETAAGEKGTSYEDIAEIMRPGLVYVTATQPPAERPDPSPAALTPHAGHRALAPVTAADGILWRLRPSDPRQRAGGGGATGGGGVRPGPRRAVSADTMRAAFCRDRWGRPAVRGAPGAPSVTRTGEAGVPLVVAVGCPKVPHLRWPTPRRFANHPGGFGSAGACAQAARSRCSFGYCSRMLPSSTHKEAASNPGRLTPSFHRARDLPRAQRDLHTY